MKKIVNKFRIVRQDCYDEYGKLINSVWVVQTHKRFLFWSYWSTLCYQADYDYESAITFSSNQEASLFITEVLIPKKPYNTFVNTVEDQIKISTPKGS